ncbi:uncharacterized protein [Anolis sagrei]|uniref:uncharacterized protein isoform X2 n=1 Tax=Anolis sagrei TaxID=38937 RepID=UPI003520E09B
MASWEGGLARAVAHRLKYYIDVQRKEDSFTSCGVSHYDTEGLYGSYVPERKNEENVKNVRWQKGLHRPSQKSLHRTATPFMSPEEVERLVSSASKLIVATISEIPSEKLGTTQEEASFLKRRDVKSIQTLDNSSRQHFSSTLFYKHGARRAKQARKNREDVKRTVELPNISSNSAKSKRFLSQPLPKPTARNSLNRGSSVSGLQMGENKGHCQDILKSKISVSGTLSVISEHKDKRRLNAQEKTFSLSQGNPPSSGGCFNKSLKMETEDFSHRPAEKASSKTNQASKCLDPRLVLRSQNIQKFKLSKNDNTKYSAEPTTAVISTQLAMTGKKMDEHYNSTAVSRCVVFPGHGVCIGDQGNPKSVLLGNSEKSCPQKREQNTCDSVSEQNSEYDKACISGVLTQEYNSLDGCSLHHLRVPEDAALAPAMVDKPTGYAAYVQEDHNNGPVAVLKHGSSFLHELCQEMDRNPPADMLMNRSVTTNETDGNQSTHSLLNPPSSLNELGNSSVVQDPVSCTKMQNIALGESHNQQMMYIPSKMADGCSCSELLIDRVNESLQQQDLAPAISETLESDNLEEEFTMSSASSSSSAASLTGLNKQRNGTAEKNADNTESSMEMLPERVLKAMPESNTTWQDIVFQDSGKQRMTDEERTNTDHGTEGICTSKIVYFSHFPKSC